MQFERDKEKAAINFKKHGVSFDEAETVFGSSLAGIFDDETHSIEEKREIIIGYSINNRLLIIIFTERDNETVRIISAREATPKERRKFENADG
ncbi:MAG TPA: BrnT family toxin [Pyrinomonadaceae bacterium]|jgi:hypothetical protein